MSCTYDADKQQEEGCLTPDNDKLERLEALSCITVHNTLLQKRVGTGSARTKQGADVGTRALRQLRMRQGGKGAKGRNEDERS
jgi:hypothetical protein